MPRVASCLLVDNDGKLLILKRSDKVRTYKGLWGVVAGYIEDGEEPFETAIKELREETGIEQEDTNLIKALNPVEYTDVYEGIKYDWIIFPFLFKTEKKDKVHIDWEHTKYRWIAPSDIGKYDTVPRLVEIVSELFQ